MDRRDILKGLATIPVLGAFSFSYWKEKRFAKSMQSNSSGLQLDFLDEHQMPDVDENNPGELLRIGIIGFGWRGEYLARTLGFAHPDWLKRAKANDNKNSDESSYNDFMEQKNLNVRVTGICEVCDVYAMKAIVVCHQNVDLN